jgi:hypothetical protein
MKMPVIDAGTFMTSMLAQMILASPILRRSRPHKGN